MFHIYNILYTPLLISAIQSLIVILPALLAVAYVTVAERKTMASMQRRLGPNIVGYYGSLQAFADALKLLLKEYVSPTQANILLFFLGPIITLIFSLLGYAVIPYGPGLSLFDINLGIFYMLAVGSIATYGILLAGWSANSKYAFLGSLRSTAQLISYELILSSCILIVILITSSLNLTINIEAQKAVWFIAPLFPICIIFFIGAVAETNRAPFDLAEAESELVSGFMTEHSAAVFVFFFLAEYASIVLICILISLLFLGGYHLDLKFVVKILELGFYVIGYIFVFFKSIIDYISFVLFFNYESFLENINLLSIFRYNSDFILDLDIYFNNFMIFNLFSSIILAIKTFIMIFLFIWVRASFPRIRFDQLMTDCWTIILPLVFAFVIFIPCIMWAFDVLPNNVLFY